MEIYDYVVVGAGPAGLAFASSIKNSNTLVVDLGKAVFKRDRFNPEECIQGAGGAGLFSDGKFSFYPAGTKIWEQDEQKLRAAYQNLKEDLSPFSNIPEFPEITCFNKRIPDQAGWLLKSYESIYLNLENRIELIANLAKACYKIAYQTEFLEQTKTVEGYLVKLKDISLGICYYIQTKKLVFAGGRFMPLFLNCAKKFQRYEFGFRIVWPHFLIQKEALLKDPKYIFEKDGVEYRTFCWCEKGEVVKTRFKGIESFSGRADCEPTGISNFGLNIRIKSASQASKIAFKHLVEMPPYDLDIKTFISNLSSYYEPSSACLVEYGLTMLLNRFKELFSDAVRIIGPTIEGVGKYPNIDKDFQLVGSPEIYVIGDCSGLYRGIIPSMLSGYLLATRQNQKHLETQRIVHVCST